MRPQYATSYRVFRNLSKSMGLFHFPQQLFRFHFHFRECKPLPAKVFQRGADMVDSIVDAEETVVDFVVELCLDGLVLGVVLLKVERELLFDFLCVDGSRDFLPSLVEHRQHSVVHIVVEQYDAFLGRADKVGNEGVGIEDLPVEEDALLRLLAGFEQLEHFFDPVVGVGLMSGLLQLMVFNHLQPLEHLCVGGKEVAHGGKHAHYLNIHLNGCPGTQHAAEHRDTILHKDVR